MATPDHTFFEQPVLKGGLCQGLLQRAGLSPQDLHFRAARLARRVTSKPLLAGLEKLFGPTVVQARRNPLAPAKLGYALLAAKPLKHDADFSSAECCLRVRRRMSFTTFSAEGLGVPGFCLTSTPWWLR